MNSSFLQSKYLRVNVLSNDDGGGIKRMEIEMKIQIIWMMQSSFLKNSSTINQQSLVGLPIVALRLMDLMFNHPFGNKETKKLIALTTFCLRSSSAKVSTPTAVPIQETFLVLNLTDLKSSSIFLGTESASATWIGSLATDPKAFPMSLMTFLLMLEETKIKSYFLAHFMIAFLSLLKSLSPSISMCSSPLSIHSCLWFMLQIVMT